MSANPYRPLDLSAILWAVYLGLCLYFAGRVFVAWWDLCAALIFGGAS